jgi:hypothetical protein
MLMSASEDNTIIAIYTRDILYIPPGQYSLENLEKYIQSKEPFNSSNISIKPNKI